MYSQRCFVIHYVICYFFVANNGCVSFEKRISRYCIVSVTNKIKQCIQELVIFLAIKPLLLYFFNDSEKLYISLIFIFRVDRFNIFFQIKGEFFPNFYLIKVANLPLDLVHPSVISHYSIWYVARHYKTIVVTKRTLSQNGKCHKMIYVKMSQKYPSLNDYMYYVEMAFADFIAHWTNCKAMSPSENSALYSTGRREMLRCNLNLSSGAQLCIARSISLLASPQYSNYWASL